MAITAFATLRTVSLLLQDTTKIRWPDDELIHYLNDGQREIALYKPNASVVTENYLLASSGSKQALPADGLVLIDVIRNRGGGTVNGTAIRVVAREVLDAQLPNWHSATGSEVRHYVYSPNDPKTFYVYPYVASGGHNIEITYGRVPPIVANVNANIQVDDIYNPALVNYICYRAYSKDAEYAANAAAATSYYQAFIAQMTGKTAGEQVTNPNISMGAFNPNVPGMK